MNSFFKPQNVAIVGASTNPNKAGHIVLKNMLGINYDKKIFPIHKSAETILDLKVYKTIDEIDDRVELIVLITPSHAIYEIMEDIDRRMARKHDIKAIVVAAAGYSETKTIEGIKREEILLKICKKHGIRMIGPNCIGVIDFVNKLNTTFVETHLDAGTVIKPSGISFVSQSGAMAASLLMLGASRPQPLGFNKFVSVGNMSDVDFIDLLEFLEVDSSTKVIGIYMEGYVKTRELIRCMARICKSKPIVVLKVGRSNLGAEAANSHTGSLAGEDILYDAAFRQYGISRVDSIQELLDTLFVFDVMPKSFGFNSYVLTQAGGPGIYTVDQISNWKKINMVDLKAHENLEMIKKLPSMANVGSPPGYSDITASATVDHHVNALGIVLKSTDINAVQFVTIVPTFLDSCRLASEMIGVIQEHQKPVFVSIMAGEYVMKARSILEKANIPTFDTPREAVQAMGHLLTYYDFVKGEV